MKKYFTLLLFILFTSITFSQNNYQDVVYLKDGSIIRGTIIEQVPNKSIKIETSDRSVFVYEMDLIEKMTKETPQSPKITEKVSKEGSGLKPGYRGIVETSYQFGLGNNGMDRLKLNIIQGGQINPYFFIGGGMGLRYYLDPHAALIPFFVHPRVNFIDKKVSPYFAMTIGYTVNASNDLEGVGMLLSPSSGVTFNVSERVALNVGLSYEMQNMKFNGYVYDYGYYDYEDGYDRKNSGAFSVDFGMSF